jgi:hypothetical protein
MCSLRAGSNFPHNGHRYVAGLVFCARRTENQGALGGLAMTPGCHRGFVALSLRHIVLATPADEDGSGAGADAAAQAGDGSSAAYSPRA